MAAENLSTGSHLENPHSEIPTEMRHSPIPEGVIMRGLGERQDPVKGKVIIDRFGLRENGILEGKIRTFNEEPGNPAEYTEGSILPFEPGPITVYITKRSLSADEINSVRELAFEIDHLLMLTQNLEHFINNTEEAARKLLNIGASFNQPEMSENEYMERQARGFPVLEGGLGKITTELAELGSVLDKMQKSLPDKHKQIGAVARQLYGLGVTFIQAKTGSTRDNAYQIAPLIKLETAWKDFHESAQENDLFFSPGQRSDDMSIEGTQNP